jgi:hypothetical protein
MVRTQGAETLHVVVSCKSRKTLDIPRALRISSVHDHDLESRAAHWRETLEGYSSETRPAADLYAGDHWKVVLRIPTVAPQLNVQIWVASAGYGLVPIEQELKPYSATFIRPHLESVTTPESKFGPREWWRALTTWDIGEHPRSVAGLARTLSQDGGLILLALSAPYALALADDIANAAKAAPGRIALISAGLAGVAAPPQLAGIILPAEARLKRLVS